MQSQRKCDFLLKSVEELEKKVHGLKKEGLVGSKALMKEIIQLSSVS